MNTIDPHMQVSEILRLYPATLDVFRSFGMKCAENNEYAAMTLEENFLSEQVNFTDLLNQLNKTVNPKTESNADFSSVRNRTIEIEAPHEIGNIVSRHISVRDKIQAIHVFGYFCLGILCLGILICIAAITLYSPATGTIIIVAVCALLIPAFLLRKTTVGVVGTKGFVVYKINKLTRQVASRRLYLYRNIKELVFPQTVNLMFGIYTGTTYDFRLSNGDSVLYKKSGKYYEDKEGENGWLYTFLCAVENTWTARVLVDLLAKLKAQGCVEFTSDEYFTKRKIEIGYGYLKCNDKKFDKREIKGISFHHGMLYIDHANYEEKYLGFKSQGDRIVMPINKMPNRKAFLTLLEKVVL